MYGYKSIFFSAIFTNETNLGPLKWSFQNGTDSEEKEISSLRLNFVNGDGVGLGERKLAELPTLKGIH